MSRDQIYARSKKNPGSALSPVSKKMPVLIRKPGIISKTELMCMLGLAFEPELMSYKFKNFHVQEVTVFQAESMSTAILLEYSDQ